MLFSEGGVGLGGRRNVVIGLNLGSQLSNMQRIKESLLFSLIIIFSLPSPSLPSVSFFSFPFPFSSLYPLLLLIFLFHFLPFSHSLLPSSKLNNKRKFNLKLNNMSRLSTSLEKLTFFKMIASVPRNVQETRRIENRYRDDIYNVLEY